MKNQLFTRIISKLLIIAALTVCLCGCSVSDANKLLGIDGLNGSGSTDDKTESETSGNDFPEIVVSKEPTEVPVISIINEDDAVITEETIAEEEEVVEEEEIYDPVGKIYSIAAASPDEITLTFAGDVGFAEGYSTINVYRQQANGVEDCIAPEVLARMRGTDIMMVNNEFPYSYRGSPTPDKTYTFRADPKDVHIMKDMGVDIVSLANNHAYDYGPDALIDTIDTLNEAMLPFVGAGKNIEEAMRPAYFKINGHTISYVSATQIERYANPDTREATEDSPGVLRTLDPGKTVKVIEVAAANSDFTVVYVHWGSESTDLVEQSQRDLAKAYVDAGADLVIGDHSHCLQGIDYVSGVPVFYSLGNYWFNSKTLDTCLVTATLDNDCKISKLEFVPCIQQGSKVKSGDGDNYDRILQYMRGISNYAEIDESGLVTESSENHNIQNGQNTSPAKKVEAPQETPGIEEIPSEGVIVDQFIVDAVQQ